MVVTYVGVWVAVFPQRVLGLVRGGATWEGLGAERLPSWLMLLPSLYGPVFVPTDSESWRAASLDESLLYLVAGALVAPTVWYLLRRARRTSEARWACVGALWPLVTVLPALGVRQLDLFRLGLLVCFAFALLWGALVTVVEVRSRVLPAVLAAVLAVWFVPLSLRTAAAWGPGGYFTSLLPSWKAHHGALWWDSLTPEMKALFNRAVEDEVHLLHWAHGAPSNLLDEERESDE
jgi:hypothetical protein